MDRSLAASWDDQAERWINWARTPGHDSYWVFHRQRFLELVPDPGRLTLDIGCGEGRVGRDLAACGHVVVGVDASATLVRACVGHETGHPAVVGNASRLPVADAVADLAVGFMSFHDLDDLAAAIGEVRRVLRPGGSVHLALVHPINSAGTWCTDDAGEVSTFVVGDSYMRPHRYTDAAERDGLEMTFHSQHRPLEDYTNFLAANGFVIERLAEVTDPDPTNKWFRIPLFLHLIARRT